MSYNDLRKRQQQESEMRSLNLKIDDASQGDRNAGIELIQQVVDTFKGGNELPPPLAHYLAACLDKYLTEHQCDNDYWADCMNTKAGKDRHSYGKRNELLVHDYADALERGESKESFMAGIEEAPPHYWRGPNPTRDALLKILPAKGHREIQLSRAIGKSLDAALSGEPE